MSPSPKRLFIQRDVRKTIVSLTRPCWRTTSDTQNICARTGCARGHCLVPSDLCILFSDLFYKCCLRLFSNPLRKTPREFITISLDSITTLLTGNSIYKCWHTFSHVYLVPCNLHCFILFHFRCELRPWSALHWERCLTPQNSVYVYRLELQYTYFRPQILFFFLVRQWPSMACSWRFAWSVRSLGTTPCDSKCIITEIKLCNK